MSNYEKRYDEMILALKNQINYVWYSDHIMDNTFVRNTIDETIRKMPEDYIPTGFCYKPEYRPERGVGFLLMSKQYNTEIWVHVPLTCFEKWLESVNLLDELFPNGTKGICSNY